MTTWMPIFAVVILIILFLYIIFGFILAIYDFFKKRGENNV